MSKTTKYRIDIQALRGLAVIAVVLFHTNERISPMGFLGVDIFFVISGFVVTPLFLRTFDAGTIKKRISLLKDFYLRRFYRLAPALAVTLMASAAIVFLLVSPSEHQRISGQGIATLLIAGNFGAYKYSGDYFFPNPNPLIHTWSLSIEEQLYIVIPLALFLILWKRKNRKSISFSFFGILTVVSLMIFLSPQLSQIVNSAIGIKLSQFSFYSPFERTWQFTLGGLIHLVFEDKKKIHTNFSNIFQLIPTLIIFFILFSPFTINQKFGSLIVSLLTSTILYFSLFGKLPDLILNRLEWFGDRSYSIYLIHMPVLSVAKYSRITQIGSGNERFIQCVIALVLIGALGTISYSRVENRFRNRYKDNKWGFRLLSKDLLYTTLVPLIIFGAMQIGNNHGYWGVDRNIEQPLYAGEIDKECARDSEKGGPCKYVLGDATKTVLLVGDSHAGHISQAVVDTAKKIHWNAVVWTHSGCLVQFTLLTKKNLSDSCLQVNLEMKEWVKTNKPDAIIISQFVHKDSPQKNLRDAITKLKFHVPNILLISNNPIFPDGKDFMIDRPIIMPTYNPPKEYLRDDMDNSDHFASQMMARWADQRGVRILDVDSIFCDSSACSRFLNGKWLYRDDDHFSLEGGQLTARPIERYLQGIS